MVRINLKIHSKAVEKVEIYPPIPQGRFSQGSPPERGPSDKK
jgi:hypothetical protein